MGEISEALRRARQGDPAAGGRTRAPVPGPGPLPRAEAVEPLREAALPPAPPVEIPDEHDGAWNARAVLVEPRGEVAEQYRHFAIRLSRRLKERGATTVVVTSATRAEGKTTTACNLALALASMAGGRRIALVELDLRRPSISAQIGVTPERGLESVLSGEASLAEVRLPTQLADLDLYLVKSHSLRALELLSGPHLGAMLRELARRYDTVIVDSPPVLPVPDVPLLLPNVDAVLVVARNGVSRRGAFRDAVEAIGEPKLVGAFLNAASQSRRARKHYGYYSYGPDPADGGGDDGESGNEKQEARNDRGE